MFVLTNRVVTHIATPSCTLVKRMEATYTFTNTKVLVDKMYNNFINNEKTSEINK